MVVGDESTAIETFNKSNSSGDVYGQGIRDMYRKQSVWCLSVRPCRENCAPQHGRAVGSVRHRRERSTHLAADD